jgi:hypothetical protein
MKICNKEFRIIEETFGDGHKEFLAEQHLNIYQVLIMDMI